MKKSHFLPLILSLGVLFGFTLGLNISPSVTPRVLNLNLSKEHKSYQKLREVIDFIDANYVERVDIKNMVNDAIEGMIKNLDPHTSFMPKTIFEQSEEMMQGNFQGIGIEFYILNDTVMVVAPVIGGPSHKLGILPGDRIISVEGEDIAGIGISNRDVVKKLKGSKGTIVNIEVFRRGQKDILDFAIQRDDIPLTSVDASIMLDDKTGFVKVTRFSRSTAGEFKESLMKLRESGMQSLVIDLRGNSGGYLDQCVYMVDQILGDNKLIVYTEGRAQPRYDYRAKEAGIFEKGKVAILIDEGSASASEIFAGAVQDWDRGVIVGRRSFGKGLVQHQYPFADSSAIRLTVSKYFTPLGRCIQKPFKKGNRKAYEEEAYQRFKTGEVYNKDSIKMNDSLTFVTPKGDTVYGGGGIYPDVYVPIDTSDTRNPIFQQIIRLGLIHKFGYNFVSKHRSMMLQYANVQDFKNNLKVESLILREFKAYAEDKGVSFKNPEWDKCRRIILTRLKASLAQQIWRSEGYYNVIAEVDDILQAALSQLN